MAIFQSSSKSNRLLQSKRYTVADFDGQEAYTSVLDINATEIFTQQNSLPTSSLPYSGSSQDGQTILSGSTPIARFYHRLRLTPGNVANSGRYQTWFAISGSDGTAVSPQLVQTDQLKSWISNKYLAAADAAKVSEGSPPGYNVVISKGASAGAAEALSVNDYQYDYKTGVIQFVGLTQAPTTSEVIYITGYVYEGKYLSDETFGGGGGGTGTGFPFSGSALITGSLVISGSGASKTLVVDGEISASAGITGSLFGTATTASYVETAQTASFVTTAQTASFVTTAQTASNVAGANVTGDFSSGISSSGLIQSFAMTASNATIDSASIAHLTVDTLISGSTIFTSGSNQLGDATADIQTLIGTVNISGSATNITSSTVDINGILKLPSITNVSASIAALEAADSAAGIFAQSGSSGVFATTSSLQVTGSVLGISPVTTTGANITSSNDGSGGGVQKYAMIVSESVWHYNANVGVPRSNGWKTGLDGSFFDNFDQNTDVSEILRFVAGLLSSSAPNALPNTKTYNAITEDIDNTTAGSIPSGRVPQNSTETIVTYLEGKGFASDGNTLFSGVDLAGSIKGNSNYHISYDSSAGGSTTVSSSNDAQLFGLGLKSLAFKVSGSNNYRFSDNASNTQTAVSQSSEILTNSSANSTSNGLTRATINTANPAVIPTAFQDGKFDDVFQANLFNGGVSLSTKESIGFYELSASIAIETGSGGFTAAKTAVERILYSPIVNGDIAANSLTLVSPFSESLNTPTSRSLSGAPYLLTQNYRISSSITGLFNPLYVASTTAANLGETDSLVTLSAPTNHATSLSTNGGTISTSNAVFPDGGGTARATSTVPVETDIIRLSGSLAFSAGTGGSTNVGKTSLSPTSFNVTTKARNRNNSQSTLRTDAFNYFNSGQSGQPVASGSMAYYGRAQDYDGGSLTGTEEAFSGEEFRIKINNNLLSGSYAKAHASHFPTASFDVYNLAKYDLQVKPNFLIYPGSTNAYWLANPDTSTDYKYYSRAFKTDGGTKTQLTLDVGQALVQWSSTSAGIAIAVMFESATTGINTGGGALTRPVIYDFATLSGTGNIASNQATDDQLNPFTDNIDIGKNVQAGSGLSGTTYTMPLTDTLNQVLNSTYQNYIILVRYKGAQTNPLDNSTYRIQVGY
jgi:hypothetical protein